jgi:lipoate-protein ligase A
LPLGGDLARICQVLRYPQESGREEASRRVRAKAATLEDVFGRPIRWGEAAQAMRSGFQRALGVQLLPGVLTLAEQERAALLEEERYAVEAWSARR